MQAPFAPPGHQLVAGATPSAPPAPVTPSAPTAPFSDTDDARKAELEALVRVRI